MNENAHLTQVLKTAFDFDGCEHFERLNEGGVNNVWKVSRGEDVRILKQVRNRQSREWMLDTTKMLQKLKVDYITTPSFCLDKEGCFFSTVGDSYYQLQKFTKGRTPQLANEEVLLLISKFIKKLQCIKVGTFAPSSRFDVECWMQSFEESQKELRHYLGGHLSKTGLNELESLLTDSAEYLHANGYADLSLCLSHGEVQGNNILLSDSGNIVVLDWDSLQLRPRIYDIATSAFFLSRKERGCFNVDHMLFSQYISFFGEDIKDELKFVPHLLNLYIIPTPHLIANIVLNAPHVLDWYIPWVMKALDGIRTLPKL